MVRDSGFTVQGSGFRIQDSWVGLRGEMGCGLVRSSWRAPAQNASLPPKRFKWSILASAGGRSGQSNRMNQKSTTEKLKASHRKSSHLYLCLSTIHCPQSIHPTCLLSPRLTSSRGRTGRPRSHPQGPHARRLRCARSASLPSRANASHWSMLTNDWAEGNDISCLFWLNCCLGLCTP